MELIYFHFGALDAYILLNFFNKYNHTISFSEKRTHETYQ
jgi:hypothetical protein